MAFIISDKKHIRFADDTSKAVVELRCDAPEDLPEADANWLPGSIAWVISTGDFYGLNSAGSWVKQ